LEAQGVSRTLIEPQSNRVQITLRDAYRHGFRASEICDLEWSAIDFARAEMHVSRRFGRHRGIGTYGIKIFAGDESLANTHGNFGVVVERTAVLGVIVGKSRGILARLAMTGMPGLRARAYTQRNSSLRSSQRNTVARC
jgi:hypothetical protein